MERPIVPLEVLTSQDEVAHSRGATTASIRTCRLEQQLNYEGYGFTLNARNEMGSRFAVKDIEPGSPAEAGGLREGDVIIEVNGHSIKNCIYPEVIAMIRSSPSSVTLLAITSDTAVAMAASDATVIEQPSVDEDIPDYTGLACFTCLCCCWPLGLCALLLAYQSSRDKEDGKNEDAKGKAVASFGLSIAGIVSGLIIVVIAVILKFTAF